MKRLVPVAAALAACVGMPAAAAPSVDRVAAITATFRLQAPGDVSFIVDILARVSEVGVSQGSGRVDVSIRHCIRFRCSTSSFAARLTAAELQVDGDLSSGLLESQMFGHPLVVDLGAVGTETALEAQAEGYQPVLPSGQVRVWIRQSRDGDANGSLMAKPCRSHAASLYREDILDGVSPVLAPALPSRLPGNLAGLRAARCA